MQAYLVDSHGYAKDLQLMLEQDVNIQKQVGNHLADTMPVSYETFTELFPTSWKWCPEKVQPYLEEIRRWTSPGLERLAQVLQSRSMLDSLPLRICRLEMSYLVPWNPLKVLLKLAEYMLLQHLWSWPILSYGAIRFVLGSIDETYEPSSGYLFDGVM